ncbi:MAG: GAF domain-containing protein [Bacteroidetes bacterium]|nr:GAF domain-containing protein [Bacteroidota bacterium]MBU2505650.1 GAF domain-containing protein [Bacteroidota bacterium]
MAEEISVDKTLSDSEIYENLLPQLISLLNIDEPLISGLSNVTAAFKMAFDKISWVGFYFAKDDTLFLGPFQGKTACTRIKIGTGVCGQSALKQETIIVQNVHEFTGHIACDGGSNSEIVVPIIKNGKTLAVFDLDSYSFSSFNEIDKFYLEKFCVILTDKLNWDNFIIA